MSQPSPFQLIDRCDTVEVAVARYTRARTTGLKFIFWPVKPHKPLKEIWEHAKHKLSLAWCPSAGRNNSSTKQINMYRAYGQHASMRRSCERICCQLILINGKKEETRCGPLPHTTRLGKLSVLNMQVGLLDLVYAANQIDYWLENVSLTVSNSADAREGQGEI